MATSYSYIIDEFKDKITDYDLAAFSDDLQEEILNSLLRKACRKFKVCVQDLSDRDDEYGEFNIDLTEDEIDILTEWMVKEWLEPIKNDTDNLHNRINTAEFSSISPANMQLAVNETYNEARRRARSLMNEYSYRQGDLESWKP